MSSALVDSRIHVLFLIISQSIGGAELHTISVAKNLDPGRFRATLVYLKDEDDLGAFLSRSGKHVHVFCGGVERKLDINTLKRLSHYVESEGVNIVVCANVYPLFYGWLVKLLSRRNVTIVEILHTAKPLTLRGSLRMSILIPFFRLVDMLVYVCENQRTYWRNRALRSRNERVIRNGIDVSLFQNNFTIDELELFRNEFGFSKDDYIVGMCGYMRPEKAHADLVRALLLVRQTGQKVKSIIIGDGPTRGAVEELIRGSGLGEHIVVTGLIEDVRLAICSCDIIAVPSHNDNFPISVLESMSLGRPVVMADVGGASELLEHTRDGFIYRRGDIEQLASYIRLLADASLRADVGRNAALSASKNFTSEEMVRRYESMFASLTS